MRSAHSRMSLADILSRPAAFDLFRRFVGGSDIEQVSTFKLLCVHLSEDVTWAVHYDYIVKMAKRRLYALRQLKTPQSSVG